MSACMTCAHRFVNAAAVRAMLDIDVEDGLLSKGRTWPVRAACQRLPMSRIADRQLYH